MSVVSANTAFAWSLYRQLGKAKVEETVFFSPVSISLALAMTHLGAKEDTAKQMIQAMHLAEMSDTDIHEGFKDLTSRLKEDHEKYTLHTANRLYPDQKYPFLDKFLADTKKYYSADTTMVDYVNNHKGAQQEINNWVAETTKQKITNLIGDGVLDTSTVLVLVNAIYFKGDWVQKFDEKDTQPGTFFVNNDDTATVQFMHQQKKFFFGMNDDLCCKSLELYYADNQLSMVILLPHDKNGLASLEESISSELLGNYEEHFRARSVEVKVTLPRFRLDQSFSLADNLKALGMLDMFDANKADFSGMDGSKLLSVSKVIHKAFIEVNEEGSEAAAATAVVMRKRMVVRPVMVMPQEFIADHPFLFFIRDNQSKAILFFGRMARPVS